MGEVKSAALRPKMASAVWKLFAGSIMLELAVLMATAQGSVMVGDVARGKTAFEKRCTGCHGLDQGKEGPRLRDVYGRAAGSAPNFSYSDSLKKLKVTWDAELLNKWLTNPDAMAPGTDMEFHVANAQERADIVRYLQAAKSSPGR